MALFTETIGDSVAVADGVIVAVTTHIKTRSAADSCAVSDTLRVAFVRNARLNDAIGVTDALSSQATIALKIDDARALTETKVRIDFEFPALVNDALKRPSSYKFNNASAGSVEVTPLSVLLPPGQIDPLYVEIVTTEHTNLATYEVALSPDVRGAAGEIGDATPFSYSGIGVAPTLQLVLAISPTEVQVRFSESIANNVDANDAHNYTWSNGLNTIAVRSVIGDTVSLQTSQQVPGTLYTLHVTSTFVVEGVVVDDDGVDVEDEVLIDLRPLQAQISDEELEIEDDLVTQLSVHLALVYGAYIAPVSRRGVQVSLDGITWTDQPGFPNDGNGFQKAAFGAGLNVITGGPAVYRSDGHGVWDAAYGFGDNSLGIAYSPELGIFVMGGANQFSVSPDGVNWATHFADVPSGIAYFYSVVWSPELGIFVAGGNEPDLIQTSPDGINWTRHEQGGDFTSGLWWGMCWCSGLGLFVAAGGNSSAPDALQSSPDGANWTVCTPGSGYAGNWLGCAASGSRIVVAGYSEGSIEVQSSSDGVTWTHRSLAGFYNGVPYGVAYNTAIGLFVICGDTAEIQTSPDGVTWTHRTPAGVTDALFRGAA